MSKDLFNVDDLLNETLKPKESLKELFEKKLNELRLTATNVLDILEISYRTLNGILEGTQKVLDVTNLKKLADLLQIPKEEVFKLYMDAIEKKFTISKAAPEKIKFIKENFDLTVLKKAGVINSLTDFDLIEKRLIAWLRLKSIFEYRKPRIDVAFSSGLFKPKNLLTRLLLTNNSFAVSEAIMFSMNMIEKRLLSFFH